MLHSDERAARRDRASKMLRFLAEVAREHDLALRVGVNCGSVDPHLQDKFPAGDSIVLANSGARFVQDFGVAPDYEFGIASASTAPFRLFWSVASES